MIRAGLGPTGFYMWATAVWDRTMDSNRDSGQDEGSTEYEDMFLCSECGFTRTNIETVIEHLDTAHNGQGQIREYQREKKPKGQLRLFLERIHEILDRFSLK